MVVLQNSNLPLSTDFYIEKTTPFLKKETPTFGDSNKTPFLQNADFHRVEVDPNCCLFF